MIDRKDWPYPWNEEPSEDGWERLPSFAEAIRWRRYASCTPTWIVWQVVRDPTIRLAGYRLEEED